MKWGNGIIPVQRHIVLYTLKECQDTIVNAEGCSHSHSVENTNIFPHIDETLANETLANEYCSDPRLNKELAFFHQQLLMGAEMAQVEIDRRLPACIAADNGWRAKFKHMPLECLYTLPGDTIQYKRLPDILRFLTKYNFKNQSGTSIFEILIHNALPCLKRGRLSQNPFSLPQETHKKNGQLEHKHPTFEFVACINILYGTLFGLYPTCSKKPTFQVRKSIFRVLHTLSVSKTEYQRHVLHKIPSIVRLCFMEYIVNVTRDYCPCEFSHFMGIKGMDIFYNICTNICDNFRMEGLQSAEIHSLLDIEELAAVYMERFTRTCKFRMQREDNSKLNLVKKVLQSWRKEADDTAYGNNMDKCEILHTALHMPVSNTKGSIRVYMLHCGIPDHDLGTGQGAMSSIIEALHNNVRCYLLPENLVKKNAESLLRFKANPQKLNSISHISLCLWCVNKNSSTPLHGNLRLDVDTNVLSCATCCGNEEGNGDHATPTTRPPVVTINMIGRILLVNGVHYYLCPGCCKIHVWEGTGYEFSGTCEHSLCIRKQSRIPKSVRVPAGCSGQNRWKEPVSEDNRTRDSIIRRIDHMLSQNTATTVSPTPVKDLNYFNPLTEGTTKSLSVTSSQVRKKKFSCLVCGKANANNMINTLHIPEAKFVTINLCNRHRIYDHLVQYIFDTDTFRKMLRQTNAKER